MDKAFYIAQYDIVGLEIKDDGRQVLDLHIPFDIDGQGALAEIVANDGIALHVLIYATPRGDRPDGTTVTNLAAMYTEATP